jgi:hypothetical protein
MAELQRGWPIVTNASSHQRLEVAADQFARRIELYATDSLQAALLLGTSPGLRQTHVRTPDSDAVFAAPVSAFEWPTGRAGWLDSTGLAVADLRAIERGGYRYERQPEGWTISIEGSGRELSQAQLDTLAAQLAGLRVTGVSDRELADAQDVALEMTVETPAGSLRLQLAATADEFLLAHSDYDTLFRLSAADYAELLDPREPGAGAAPTEAAAAESSAPDVHQSETG